MSDKELDNEILYLFSQVQEKVKIMQSYAMNMMFSNPNPLPVSKITEDYNLIIERLQMALEENEYRQIP